MLFVKIAQKMGGDDFSFRVLIGNPLICPECGRLVRLERGLNERQGKSLEGRLSIACSKEKK